MRAILFLFSLLLFAATPCFAQTYEDHLEPIDDSPGAPAVDAYYAELFVLLYRGFDAKPRAQCAVISSFFPEYAWSVTWKTDGPYLYTNRLSENLWKNRWYGRDKDALAIVSQSIRLEPDLARAVEELLRTAGERIAVPQEEFYGLDGTTYRFSTTDKNGDVLIGETWSPKEGTQMSRLVGISDELFALAGETGKPGSTQAELTTKVRRLTEDMRR